MTGASQATGLGNAKAPEPHSRLRPTGAIPCAWTPGPWSSERDLPHNRMPRVHGGDNSLICEVGNMGTTQDQWEVNAALIAAAPELYTALSEIISDGEAQYDINVRDRAWAALRKARGEQP